MSKSFWTAWGDGYTQAELSPGILQEPRLPIPGHVHPVNLSLIPISRKHQLENGQAVQKLKNRLDSCLSNSYK